MEFKVGQRVVLDLKARIYNNDRDEIFQRLKKIELDEKRLVITNIEGAYLWINGRGGFYKVRFIISPKTKWKVSYK